MSKSMTDRKVQNSTIFVTRSIKRQGVEETSGDEDVIAVHQFVAEPAHVTVDYHLTMNLGNYESARIGVSVQVPCYAEEIDEAYTFAQSWVASRLEKEKSLVQGVKQTSRKSF